MHAADTKWTGQAASPRTDIWSCIEYSNIYLHTALSSIINQVSVPTKQVWSSHLMIIIIISSFKKSLRLALSLSNVEILVIKY